MGSAERERECWIVQPLIDAGLGLEQIRELVFHLAFDAITSEGRGTLASVGNVVAGQPTEVRTAWAEVIGRMMTWEGPPG